MKTANAKRLVEIPDVMAELGLGRTKVYDLIETKQLTRVRIGSRAYVLRESLDSFIDGLAAARD
jgi:predicted DNA-binding transcriptional regulator AlpA